MTKPSEPHREDDTVRTLLDRASRRARRVSQRCSSPPPSGVRPAPGLRAPVPGTVERVDPERLDRISPAPQNVEREDTYEQGLAARVRLR